MRLMNVSMRKNDAKSKVTTGKRRDSIIRNLDRLTSGLE